MTHPSRSRKCRTQRPSHLPLLSLGLALSAASAQAAQISPTPQPIYPDLEVAGILDYDGDGLVEILGTEARTGQLGAYRVDPFGRPALVQTLADDGFALRSVISADMDGDGLNDLVGIGGSAAGGTIVVFYDRGGERFEPFVPVAQTSRADQLVAVDFDANGRLDLLVYPASERLDDPQGSPDTIRVLTNLGGGAFDAATSTLSFPEALRNAAPLHLDPNGEVDFAAIRPTSGSLVVARKMGAQLQIMAIPGSEQNIRDLAVGDVNGDGIDDVVTLRTDQLMGGSATVDLYLGLFGGTLSAPIVLLADQQDAALDVSLATDRLRPVERRGKAARGPAGSMKRTQPALSGGALALSRGEVDRRGCPEGPESGKPGSVRAVEHPPGGPNRESLRARWIAAGRVASVATGPR